MSRRMSREDARIRRNARMSALARPELRAEPKPAPVSEADIELAKSGGRFTRLPPQKRSRR
jgi:hypothetical protein